MSAASLLCTLMFSGGVVLHDVPLAATTEQQRVGLSNRDSAGQGMLFAWPDSKLRVVWMRDTRIPLSVGFIAADGTITSIIDMEPMTDDYHYSTGTAKDALELAQGQFQLQGIATGSILISRDCS